jgi:hypothetical protein
MLKKYIRGVGIWLITFNLLVFICGSSTKKNDNSPFPNGNSSSQKIDSISIDKSADRSIEALLVELLTGSTPEIRLSAAYQLKEIHTDQPVGSIHRQQIRNALQQAFLSEADEAAFIMIGRLLSKCPSN